MSRLAHGRKGATSIEYGLLAALVALAVVAVLPKVSHSLETTLVTSREGLKGKTCVGDPTASGIQCN